MLDLGVDLPATFLSLLVLRMPGGDKAGTVVSRTCGRLPLMLERGEQLCLASLIRNAYRCINTGDDDCAPKTSPCKLFCSMMDPQGWLLKPRLATSSLPFLALALLRALSHTHTRTRSVSLYTPLSVFLSFLASSRCIVLSWWLG